MRCAILWLAVAVLCGCGRFDVKWREEVRLADGRLVVVRRTAEGKPLGEIGGPGGWGSTRMTLEIDQPALADAPPPWSERWVPMLFDQDPANGEWFLVATFYLCTDWYDLGRPRLPYLQYRVRDGRWVQVPLEPELYGRKANLLTGVKSGGEPGLVTLEAKAWRESNAGKSFQEVVPVWRTTC